MRLIGMSVGVVMFAVACGGGDSGGDKNYGTPLSSPAAGAAAKNAVDDIKSLSTLESMPNSDAALNRVGTTYSSALTMVNAKLAEHPPTANLAEALRTVGRKPFDPSCYTATASMVTYNDCNYGGGSIDGTISWGSGTFAINVAITVTSNGQNVTVKENGTLTVTETAVKGDFAIDAKLAGSGVTLDYAFDTSYDVTLTNGCPTGGTIEVHGDWTLTQPQNYHYDVWVKADFGPTCNDVKVY